MNSSIVKQISQKRKTKRSWKKAMCWSVSSYVNSCNKFSVIWLWCWWVSESHAGCKRWRFV